MYSRPAMQRPWFFREFAKQTMVFRYAMPSPPDPCERTGTAMILAAYAGNRRCLPDRE